MFDEERGFGFIRSPGRKGDYFVHIGDIEGRRALTPGQRVTFEPAESPKGPKAVSVRPGKTPASPLVQCLGLAAALILVSALFLWDRGGVSFPLALLLGINLCTFALYGCDKAVAGRGTWRVPEKAFHALAILGGTPAAFFAQRVFRHKTIKASFQIWFWAIAFLQIIALAWWLIRY